MFSVSNRPVVVAHGPHMNNTNSSVLNVKQMTANRPSLVERIKDNVRYNYNHYSKDSIAMKWSSSNSSLSSGAGDRKSVFYTDPDLPVNEKMTDIIAVDLRDKLQRTEESLEMQVRKCENLISFFTTQIQCLTDELETEKSWRTNHLTKIVKALLCFEAKLKNDQKLIRSQLYEKDGEINRLYREIVVLRERYGDTSDLSVDICEAAQYCPTCRKEYHLLETKDVAIQVYTNNYNITSITGRNQCTATTNTDTSPTQSVEYLSSSEEGITSFVEARRSKKYMSKRTSGTFRDYLRSRSGGSDQQQSAQHEECGATTFNNNIKNINNNNNTVDSSNNNYQTQHSSNDDKENQMVAEKKRKNKETLFKRNNVRGSYSSYINNMHGFRTRSNSDVLLNDHDDGGVLYSARSMNSNGDHNVDGAGAQIDRNDDLYNNDADDDNVDVSGANDEEMFQSSNSSFLKKYESEDGVTKNEFESTDDWYASASDMDDSDGGLSKPYGYNAVNPVLECVNQILLQQSMDGSHDISTSHDVNENSPKETRNQKRVHFSTQNSMVQVPRTDSVFQPIASEEIKLENTKELNSFSYESVYSNEYEPIGSENTCTTNHYVDMESKIGQDDRSPFTEKLKTPPALPPKPANLMKIRQVLKISAAAKALSSAKPIFDTMMDNESEPDYCSISEVAAPIAKSVRIVADVHKNADEMSTVSDDTKTDVTDESFADVPKLPNVAAIISPKKEAINQFIAQDNYITKSPVKQVHIKQLPNILAEINRKNKTVHPIPTRIPKMTTINESKPSTMTVTVASVPAAQPSVTSIGPMIVNPIVDFISDDKMPLQAEFDWYNLDAEYGKAHRSDEELNDVIDCDRSTIDDEKSNGMEDTDLGIEYNLDEEFIQIDEVDEHETAGEMLYQHQQDQHHHHHVPKTTSIMKFDPMAGCDTPHKTFESFLNETGLTSKPLPRKRKIFYSAPFL